MSSAAWASTAANGPVHRSAGEHLWRTSELSGGQVSARRPTGEHSGFLPTPKSAFQRFLVPRCEEESFTENGFLFFFLFPH